jgi:predicted Rossmann-fold nucleotide-binding protein
MNRQAAMDQSTLLQKGFQPILLTLVSTDCFLPRMSEQKTPIRSVCVYCGSQPGRDPAYHGSGPCASANAIAENGMRLVYGGGTQRHHGRGRLRRPVCNGGKVIGIIPGIPDGHGGDAPFARFS